MVNKKKKRITVFILIVLACLLAFAVYKIATVEYYLLYTEDINDYYSEKYSIPSTIFPSQIPSNAQVVSFSYYNYWHKAEDVYLELKFNSTEEMEDYLSVLKSQCITVCKNNPLLKEDNLFASEKNPYNEAFTDLFCLIYFTSSQNKDYTGYRIEKNEEEEIILYECNFGFISYSYDELTVIHSRVRGWYVNTVHNYIPKYFVRFDIPLDTNHERLIYLEE